jgi:hypothetical protein
MTPEQRERFAEHAPYTIAETGEVLDVNGLALARLYFPPNERVLWDEAFVAALNALAQAAIAAATPAETGAK